MEEDLKNEEVEEENKSAISADLIRGHINTIILRTLTSATSTAMK